MCKKLIVLAALITVFFLSITASASESAGVIYYFGETCPVCLKLSPYINSISERFPGIVLKKKEVHKNKENAIDLYQVAEKFNIPRNQVRVPFLVIGDTVLLGYDSIIERADEVITQKTGVVRTSEFKPSIYWDLVANVQYYVHRIASMDFAAILENKIHKFLGIEVAAKSEKGQEKVLSLLPITAAAIADSVNPCAILVLIVLLTALIIETSSKLKLLSTAASFISAVYIAYLLVGLGLVSALGNAAMLSWFYLTIGSVAVIVGLSNIKDAIKPGAFGFVTEIPRAWRPTLMKYLARATSPVGAFTAGFVVTLFELPCTGGPYLFAISLLAGKLTAIQSLPWLLYYNAIFVAPLVIISTMVIYGKDVEAVEMWQRSNTRGMHLISGMIMLFLGIWLTLRG